ncbi:hypothetical protein J1614_003108 [Plenodomus biglobosus]|nr:hypothetical protein J1614_003108 [Plenodomus biglobosus]
MGTSTHMWEGWSQHTFHWLHIYHAVLELPNLQVAMLHYDICEFAIATSTLCARAWVCMQTVTIPLTGARCLLQPVPDRVRPGQVIGCLHHCSAPFDLPMYLMIKRASRRVVIIV